MKKTGEASADLLRARGIVEPIEVAVVLGTGLGSLVDAVEDPLAISYDELPDFPPVGVAGHAGRLVVGTQEGTRIAYLEGRTHFYENGDAAAMAVPLEALALLGVHTLILTCAAGSVRADLYPGHIAMITDHINLTGRNPLIGSATDGGFINLADAYDKKLVRRLKHASATAGITLQEGVYMWFSGPSFETPAEIKMARLLGADLVGMSIVPEAILARRLALRVGALAIISHFGAGFSGGNPSHAEIQQMTLSGSIGMKRLLRNFLRSKEEAWSLRAKPEDVR
jgi:purine-nucleoside phosphorylase